MTFYEVHGKKCYDLLSNRNVVNLRSDGNDDMHVRGAKSIELQPLHDASQLIDLLRDALSLRSSTVTERNPISSRSHAVCTIELLASTADATVDPVCGALSAMSVCASDVGANLAAKKQDRSLGNYLASKQGVTVVSTDTNSGNANSTATVTGKITLVDLAGSERNYETTKMTGAQHKESADINFALMALKDCFRAYHAQLTKHLLLQQCAASGGNGNASAGTGAGAVGVVHAPNLFTSTTNATGVVKTIHNVGVISGTKSTSLTSCTAAAASSIQENMQNIPPSAVDTLDKGTDHCGENAPAVKSAGAGVDAAGAVVGAESTSALRIPFRASLLTRVLKQCFTSGPQHRTTIMATISPTPTDLQHTLNTLNHVVLMCPELQQLVYRLTVDVPLNLHLHMGNKLRHAAAVGSGLSTKPVSAWNADDVISWLATAERGRFKHVVLPTGIDGTGLLQLSETHIGELFAEQQQNTARVQKEGAAWVETVSTRRVRSLGRALWSALRREMRSAVARDYQQQLQKVKM